MVDFLRNCEYFWWIPVKWWFSPIHHWFSYVPNGIHWGLRTDPLISTLFSSPHLLDLRMRNMPSAAAKSRTPHTSSPWTFGSPKIGHGMPWPWRRKYPDHLKDSELSMVYSRFAGHCIKKIDPNGRIFSLPYPSISIHIHPYPSISIIYL